MNDFTYPYAIQKEYDLLLRIIDNFWEHIDEYFLRTDVDIDEIKFLSKLLKENLRNKICDYQSEKDLMLPNELPISTPSSELYKRFIKKAVLQAEDGDIEAQHLMGLEFFYQAQEWFSRAAKEGCHKSDAILADMNRVEL